MSASPIKTRLLIVSDTHGEPPYDLLTDGVEALQYSFRRPFPKADVAIHCGDLTITSTPDEFEVAFDLMREIDAPLKLVIPGNHDSALDLKYWEKVCRAKEMTWEPARVAALRQRPAEAYAIVERVRQEDGIHLLIDEGTYHFVLPSGAKLTVFASPWTPVHGQSGFQYAKNQHEFPILKGTDVVITHGPPFSILDKTAQTGKMVGCKRLLRAVARAKPQVHCFGHIHECSGAAMVQWDSGNEAIWELGPNHGKDEENNGVRTSNICAGDRNTIGFEEGRHTFFINAAIMTAKYEPEQPPWLVDLDLSPSDDEHRAKAEETSSLLAIPKYVGGIL